MSRSLYEEPTMVLLQDGFTEDVMEVSIVSLDVEDERDKEDFWD